MKQIAQNYKSGELTVLDVPAPGVPARRGAGPVAVLADLHRHRDDEGDRGQDVAWSARPGPGRTRSEGPGLGGPAGRAQHLQEGDEPARLLHPARLLAVRRGDRGRPRRRGVPASASSSPRPATSTRCTPSTTGSRSTCACRCPTGWRPSTRRSPPSAPSPCRGSARPRCQLGDTACVIGLGLVGQLVVRLLVAAGVQVVGLDVLPDRCPLAEKAGAVLAAAPTEEGLAAAAQALAQVSGGLRRGPRAAGRGRLVQRPGRGRGPAGQGPGPDRGHRQDQAGPALERLLRQGARRPVLPLVRARAATTTGTSSRASTTRRATCGGPSGATWPASST